jgi:subtilisin
MRAILLPRSGLHFAGDAVPCHSSLAAHAHPGGPPITVLETARRNGAVLVDIEPAAAEALRSARPDLRVVPEVHYHPAWVRRDRVTRPPADPRAVVTFAVVSAVNSMPISGARVAAIVDPQTGEGAAGTTDSRGAVTLTLPGPGRPLAALYAIPSAGYWSYLSTGATVRDGMQLPVAPIDLSAPDDLRRAYGLPPDGTGGGVKVGVVDTGVGPHPDLTLAGGENFAAGDDPADYGDNGLGHGTHVAGIVAARGRPPTGVRGIAPGVALYSYRVYAKGAGTCTNFALVKALAQAVADGCDLINLSLALGAATDEAVRAALAAARDQGSLCFAASGNTTFGDRGAVDYPASDPTSVAVSASGRLGGYPADTLETDEAAAPFGTDPKDFISRFSNVGPQIQFTGPGVGIVSTFPGGYAVMDGTSMACPAACGRAAARLAAHPGVLARPRTAARADEMLTLLRGAAEAMGFGPTYEGFGRL